MSDQDIKDVEKLKKMVEDYLQASLTRDFTAWLLYKSTKCPHCFDKWFKFWDVFFQV